VALTIRLTDVAGPSLLADQNSGWNCRSIARDTRLLLVEYKLLTVAYELVRFLVGIGVSAAHSRWDRLLLRSEDQWELLLIHSVNAQRHIE
jgi:hypothetical protein